MTRRLEETDVKRQIHYEAAFEDYLRSRGLPYVPVDEARRAIFAGSRVKSFDFLVYFKSRRHWIVDVKGRRFPYRTASGSRYWENWVSRDDLDGLSEWQKVFGPDFEVHLLFAYLLDGDPDRWPAARPHCFGDQYYAFLHVPLSEYIQNCRPRSAAWETVTVPVRTFREMARPLESVISAVV